MTRLSDSLRGLADRAPIDHATVSVAGAARRIQRGRRLRAAANVTAGVGVAAVVALAAIHPGGTTPLSAADSADTREGAGATAPAIASAEDAVAGWGWGACGTRPFDDDFVDVSGTAEFFVELTNTVAEPATVVSANATIVPSGSVDDISAADTATVVIFWDGYAVARETVPVEYVDATAPIEAPLINCWDGAELPGGDYEMVVVQEVSFALPEEPAETADVVPALGTEQLVSNVMSIQITGDRYDNPFDVYLFGQPVEYPDDYLTPATARAEYAAHATLEPWNMAPGTQRVVMSYDGLNAEQFTSGNPAYFGCPWEGTMAGTFPQESAKWDLLAVTARLPQRLSLSYGWIVDDNPEVSMSVSNVSEFSLPGFWSEPNSSITLVKDGKVVGESYLTSINRSEPAGLTNEDGMLASGATLDGRYLWRDLTGCWTGDAPSTVESGTYTVLNVQSLYLDSGAAGMPAEPYLSDLAEGEARGSIAVMPAMDYVEIQVWTSLGTITVN